MAAKVLIDVTTASNKKSVFSYEEHATFMAGRMPDCHICIEDDGFLSRHHFLIEINPPHARLQDLGSLNGTYVNGSKLVSRPSTETTPGGLNQYAIPWIDLQHGDVIKTGDTVYKIIIQSPEPTGKAVKCQKCGRDCSKAIGAAGGEIYFCDICRKLLKNSSFELLQQFLDEPKSLQSSPGFQNKGFQSETPFEITDFDVVKVLGTGSSGAAYLLKHRGSGHETVIKLMLPGKSVSTNLLNKFLHNTVEVRDLKHNNINRFHESGIRNGIFYFQMDYANLGNMDALRKGGKIPIVETIMSSLQILEALTHAHSEELVHRNIKPQNILLHQTDGNLTAKLSDFGLAKHFSNSGLSGMTLTGALNSALPFIPNEQIINYQISEPASDIWSLGATMYYMLTGKYPRDFAPEKDPLEITLNTPIVPMHLRAPSLPPEVTGVIDRALRDDPAERYQHAGEMLSALRRIWKKKH